MKREMHICRIGSAELLSKLLNILVEIDKTFIKELTSDTFFFKTILYTYMLVGLSSQTWE